MGSTKKDQFVDWMQVITLVATILLALAGYYYSHYSQLSYEKHQAELARVNDQLRNLYGPLYSFSKVTYKTWLEFQLKYRPEADDFFDPNNPPTEAQRKAYYRYMEHVIKPYHKMMETTLLDHADLIEEKEMPLVLLDLSAYIASHKMLFAAWEEGDHSHDTILFGYPIELDDYAERMYLKLKERQLSLTHLDKEL